MASERDGFVHLHVHTDYSMLDGASKIPQLMKAAAELNMPAIAITDHGNTFGAYEFWREGGAQGVKPIIGIEAYLTPGTHRTEQTRVQWGDGAGDDVSSAGAYTHMTLLAESTAGMHNVFRLSSLASMEGFYYKPRMDREILQRYAKGIIATTGCPSGEVQTRLRLGQYREALTAASDYRDIFGKDNFFCEIMDHGLEIERGVQKELLRLAKELGLPLVATNDLHYVHKEDSDAHSALLCIQSNKSLNDPTRFKFDGSGYYLKDAQEMRRLFKEFPEACDNTLLIAERCQADFDTAANYMPRFPVPEGESEASWFVKEVQRGLQFRYPTGIPEKVQRQADYEIDIITKMDFPGYFLVVADFINWAKDNGVRVGPGRGSGAGSMAAYAMRITELDPLEHGLIFERFLNPDRVSMPDFDVDFDDRRRGEVIDYVTRKYGDERVAQIITYSTIKSKAALKDAARVLEFPFSYGERLTKAMPPPVMGKDISLGGMLDEEDPRYREAAEFRTLLETDDSSRTIYDTALGLEGIKRQWSVHAAGVIMSSEPLLDIIPLIKRPADGQIVTQFDYPACESLGLIKMDFLGLRNLTVISDALANIKKNRGIDLDIERLTLDDELSYELLTEGHTLGVFQLDSPQIRSLLRQLRPDNFEDISAVLALYRPGPMGAHSHTNYALRKNGKQQITPIHPELAEPLKDILDTTYGLIVYQEQVMSIAQKVAGFTLGEADILRRAMGKKKKSELDQLYEKFRDGMIARGFSAQAIKTLWDILLPFSDYAFNKAHSAAYGLVSYWTAYLKAHYPAEYMAALLTSTGDDKDKLAVYLEECRRMNIDILPPHVNHSEADFAAVGDDIRFGLLALRNVGQGVVQAVTAERDSKGSFESFHDFVKRVPLSVLNKRTVESLIKGGALDDLGGTRRALSEAFETIIEAAVKEKREAEKGNVGFNFDDIFALKGGSTGEAVQKIPERAEWPKRLKLQNEREILGLYVSDHPLAGLEGTLAKKASHQIVRFLGEGRQEFDGESVTVAGLISVAEHLTAKSGKLFGRLTVEDFSGKLTVLFFNQTYQEYARELQQDTIVAITGKLRVRDEDVSLSAYSIEQLKGAQQADERLLELSFKFQAATEQRMAELQELFARYPGECEVRINLFSVESVRVFEISQTVRMCIELASELKGLLGVNCMRTLQEILVKDSVDAE